MEDFTIDTNAFDEQVPVKEEVKTKKKAARSEKTIAEEFNSQEELINCLRKETITVQFIKKETSGITDKRHPYYGGRADGAFSFFTVPLLKNGTYANVLTKQEKTYLEYVMGLEYNALSVHRKDDNYWENYMVRLTKEDKILHLDDPHDYIDYKVLLANKDTIADSLATLRDYPKATYQFVLVSDGEVYSTTVDKTTNIMKCYKEFGKVEDDINVLRCILETIEGRKVAANSKIEFLKEKIVDIINSDSKRFLSVITDPLLNIKVTLMTAVEEKVVSKRGDYYYYEGSPLCGNNEDPTITVASKYLGLPKNQELLFAIQAKVKSKTAK